MAQKKTVFMTGGTGTMGWAAFQEMLKKPNEIKVKLLARKGNKNFELLKPYLSYPNVEIVWGDLLDYDSILKGVTGADYVLHIGGMVSPAADYKPYTTLKTNTTAAEYICKAVLEQPNADDIKVCYIGTVAETGNRGYPIHWGRTGDPIKISIYDHYAVSKTIAEKTFVESGIKNWVVMRQSGILYPALLHNMEPIMYHVPLNGVLEWATVEDSGRLMCNLVTAEDLPEEFWNSFYNIGSGEDYRLTNYEFEKLLLGSIGLGDPKGLFNPNWFTLKNFHGQFYADSDKLENYLHFRENLPVEMYFDRMAQQVEAYFRIPKYIPTKKLIAACAKPFMKKIAETPKWGTLDWIKNKDQDRLTAYYGTYEDWQSIGHSWDTYELAKYNKKVKDSENYKLDHGYDESKPTAELDLNDMKKAAEFRGGKCLSKKMTKGDMRSKLTWKCGTCGEEFEASPTLILKGGHWCPKCFIPTEKWNYDEVAKTNPFFAQVWYPEHREDEHNVYVFDEIFEGWEKKR